MVLSYPVYQDGITLTLGSPENRQWKFGKLAKIATPGSKANSKGNAMTKIKTNAPAPVSQESLAAPLETATATAKPSGNMLSGAASAINAKLAEKAELFSAAKQKLAEAHDIFAEGKAKTAEANEAASNGAATLYRGAVAGLFSPAEVSSALGDVFGYKPKKDQTPGKTPAGEGEAIRKRLARAVAAYQHVTGGDGGKFFAGLPVEEVEPIVAAIGNGNRSLFSAYDDFADIKKAHMVKTEAAFNVKTIEGICEGLSKPEAPSIIRGNPELQRVYGAMLALLQSLDSEG